MRLGKPKYTVGDAFLVTKTTIADGCKFTGEFKHYVLSVQVGASSEGYEFKYGLAPDFPSSYHDVSTTLWHYETSLSKLPRAEGYFG